MKWWQTRKRKALERLKREVAEDVQAIEAASDGAWVPVRHVNALELAKRFEMEAEG